MIVGEWIEFNKDYPKTHPTMGGYIVCRKDGKIHFEVWNGTGWAYNHNEIRYWAKIQSPLKQPTMKKATIKREGKTDQPTVNIMDRVKTFEDACQVVGLGDTISTIEVSDSLEGDLKSIAAYTKLIIIARALNEGWTPNWEDENEKKWYPWFKMSAASASRTRATFSGARARTPAPTFASNHQSWPNMPALNFWISTKNF
jgi:hypothetical protein